MTQEYLFARYIPQDARKAAATRTYRPRNAQKNTFPRCADGYCPLGRILYAITGRHGSSAPMPGDVIRALHEAHLLTHVGPVDSIKHSMIDFIHAWDLGRLNPDQLPAALGLTPEESS